jgi:hypothetical protein
MSKLARATFIFWTLPFLVFLVIAFTPWWISIPFTLLGVLTWIGTGMIMVEENKKQEGR